MGILLVALLLALPAQGQNLRVWVSEKLYNTFYGKCDSVQMPSATELDAMLAHSGCTSPHSEFIANVKNIQEQVFFDSAAALDLDQKSCKLTYLDQFDARADDPQLKTADDTISYLKRTSYPNLKEKPERAKLKTSENAVSLQNQIARDLVEKISDIQKLDREIRNLERQPYSAGAAAYGSPETAKAVAKSLGEQPEKLEKAKAARAALYKSIWNIDEPEVKAMFDEMYWPFNNHGAPDFPAELMHEKLTKGREFQTRIIEPMKSRTSGEIGSVNAAKRDYPNSYKRTLVKSGIIYDDIFTKTPGSSFYSSMQCRMEASYGKGDEATTMAVDVGLTVVGLIAGGLPSVLKSAVSAGYLTAQSASILSTVAIVTEGTAGLAGLAVNNFTDKCSDRSMTVEPGVCGKVAQLQKSTDPLETVRTQFDAQNCALTVVMDALQVASLFHSLSLIRRTLDGGTAAAAGKTPQKFPEELFQADSDYKRAGNINHYYQKLPAAQKAEYLEWLAKHIEDGAQAKGFKLKRVQGQNGGPAFLIEDCTGQTEVCRIFRQSQKRWGTTFKFDPKWLMDNNANASYNWQNNSFGLSIDNMLNPDAQDLGLIHEYFHNFLTKNPESVKQGWTMILATFDDTLPIKSYPRGFSIQELATYTKENAQAVAIMRANYLKNPASVNTRTLTRTLDTVLDQQKVMQQMAKEYRTALQKMVDAGTSWQIDAEKGIVAIEGGPRGLLMTLDPKIMATKTNQELKAMMVDSLHAMDAIVTNVSARLEKQIQRTTAIKQKLYLNEIDPKTPAGMRSAVEGLWDSVRIHQSEISPDEARAIEELQKRYDVQNNEDLKLLLSLFQPTK